MPTHEPERHVKASPLATAALIIGTCLSVATTCGPPEPGAFRFDTGTYWRDTGYTEPDYGFTIVESTPVALEGVGDTEVHTIHVTLDDRCTMEVPEYAWGYPTGWVLGSAVLEAGPADTGGTTEDTDTTPPDDTGTSVDTGPDTGTSVDTGADTGSVDTGADTGSVDTGSVDTGSIDTSAGGDTGFWGWDTGEAPPAAKVRIEMVRGDGEVLPPIRLRIAEDGSARDAVFDETPFTPCGRDEVCSLDWTVTFTLVEGDAVHGVLDANVRLRMCSSGPPLTSDLTLTVD